jgi:hypothetical protein
MIRRAFLLIATLLATCTLAWGQLALPPAPPLVLQAETQAFVGRIATAGYPLPNQSQLVAYDNLIKSLKTVYPGETGSAWTRIDVLYAWATYNGSVALLNVRANNSTGTLVNSPTFTVGKGYAGNGTSSYINSNFNPSTASSPQYVKNSAHVSVWPLNVGSFSYVAGTASVRIGLQNGNSQITGRLNDGTSTASAVYTNNSSLNDLSVINRSSSAGYDYDWAGQKFYTNATASVSVDNDTTKFLANVAASQYSTVQLAFASIGGALTDQDLIVLRSAEKQFLLAMGQVTSTSTAIGANSSNLVRAVADPSSTTTTGACIVQSALKSWSIAKDGPHWTFELRDQDFWSGGLIGPLTITAASWSSANGGQATFTTSTANSGGQVNANQYITVASASPSGYNGSWLLTAIPNGTNLTVAMPSNPGAWVSGGTLSYYGYQRDEMSCPSPPTKGAETWLAYSFEVDPVTTPMAPFPSDGIAAGWSVTGQMHQSALITGGSPTFAMSPTANVANVSTEQLTVTRVYDTNGSDTTAANQVKVQDYAAGSPPVYRGHVYHVVLDIKEDTSGAGFLKFYVDGNTILNETSINVGYAADTTGSYPKFGFYGGIQAVGGVYRLHYWNVESCQSPCTLTSRIASPLPVLQ